MIPVEWDGSIVLSHQHGGNNFEVVMSLAEAEQLAQKPSGCLDQKNRQDNARANAAMHAIARELDVRCASLRGKAPWELTGQQWESIHAPIVWIREPQSPSVPPYLRRLTLSGRLHLQLVREAACQFEARIGFSPYGYRLPGKLNDQRHCAHVAYAVMRGLRVPPWVIAACNVQYWIDAEMVWVLRHLDRAAWATQLANRPVSAHEIDVLESLAIKRWQISSRNKPHPLNDPGQWFDRWEPAHINERLALIAASRCAA